MLVDEDGLPIQEFYVSIGIHWDGIKKCRTTVHGFREGTSYEWMLDHFKRWLRCKGDVVEDPRLGKVIQLQGNQGLDVGKCVVNSRFACRQQVSILEFDGQYKLINKVW